MMRNNVFMNNSEIVLSHKIIFFGLKFWAKKCVLHFSVCEVNSCWMFLVRMMSYLLFSSALNVENKLKPPEINGMDVHRIHIERCDFYPTLTTAKSLHKFSILFLQTQIYVSVFTAYVWTRSLLSTLSPALLHSLRVNRLHFSDSRSIHFLMSIKRNAFNGKITLNLTEVKWTE